MQEISAVDRGLPRARYRPKHWRMPIASAMLMLVTAMTMTGANVPLAKALLAHLPAEVLLLLRFALASACLAVLARLEPGPPLSSLGARQWGAVIVLGLVGSVMFTWFVLEGVRRTSGASAGIITATLPAVVALAGFVSGIGRAQGSWRWSRLLLPAWGYFRAMQRR